MGKDHYDRGQYEFYTLVTCLIILVLQIHNPFQSTQQGTTCKCDGGVQTPSQMADPGATSARKEQGKSAEMPSMASAASSRSSDPPPSYRRPREAKPIVPSQQGGGLSTDALLRELDSIQAKAKNQQETLAAAGRMPPASPILQHLKETERAEGGEASGPAMGASALGAYGVANHQTQAPAAPAAVVSSGLGLGGAAQPSDPGANPPMLRRRDDFGRFLEARQPRGIGIVLGVGRGDFAISLLQGWPSVQGIFLIDPYIHMWKGYDDPANLDDREHQMVYEALRNRLTAFEGKYVLQRDFSHSFAETYRMGGQAPGLPTFIYVDANHAEKAVSRDLETWWPLVAPGGILAGSTYMDDDAGRIRVQSVVDKFASKNRVNVFLTHDDSPPSWFIVKE
mmetsp:Transcript_112434/g.223408  ORF Transcript_112434/g.223408 Transcript_112434/m.223408 type:complete len:395 (+) Transcript_112434:90-1274(+)